MELLAAPPIGNACAPSEPIPQAEWNAAKKAMSEAPKDVKEATTEGRSIWYMPLNEAPGALSAR